MSDASRITISLRLKDMMKVSLPTVDPDGFDAIYSTQMIARLNTAFKTAACPTSESEEEDQIDARLVSEAWRNIDRNETLCLGYLLNIVFNTSHDETDSEEYTVEGSLILKADAESVKDGDPAFIFSDLCIIFKYHGSTEDDALGDDIKKTRPDLFECPGVRSQLMSCAERIFRSQHRTALFMLLVDGGEFRIIRWDRSGCIVTEPLSYIDSVEDTRKLLEFFYAYSKATHEQRGFDPTATRLSKDSCGWKWMQKVAGENPLDVDYEDETVIQSLPPGFVTEPTPDAPLSSLFTMDILANDPTEANSFGDLSSFNATSAIAPVFKYVRDLFRGSISETVLCHCLKVCGHDYLVGKPVFAARGLIGRGTRGYVALEWRTQRLVFLKDTWRPFYEGVDQEGTTLEVLNAANVTFVPTLVCHEDVGGTQETEASQCWSTGSKKHDAFGENKNRPIAPFLSPRPEQRLLPEDTANMQTPGKDAFGLRHLTHYRIIVTEICLPSTDIQSGEQLLQVILSCLLGHQDAFVKCGLLHSDISSGNILIRPTVICIDPETGERAVIWYGLLCDWELAKALPKDDSDAKAKARQPHRVGTWYYMSVCSLIYPSFPLSLADELESFLHVMIYLAVRFLRTSALDVKEFVESYFEGYETWDNQLTCSPLKRMVVRNGSLGWHDRAIHFVSGGRELPVGQGEQPQTDAEYLSPLNDVIATFLAYLEARYAVLDYELHPAATKVPKPLPSLLQSEIDTGAATSSSAAEKEKRQIKLARRMQMGIPDFSNSYSSVHKVPTPRGAKRRTKPPQSVYDLAAMLKTHEAVIRLLAHTLEATQIWPSGDYAGDQLKGYARPAGSVSCGAVDSDKLGTSK